MGKRGLYPNTSDGNSYQKVKNQMDVISYLDGKRDLMEIAEICSIDFDEVWKIVCGMLDVDLVELLDI
jgi:aminopeptidase-like protein